MTTPSYSARGLRKSISAEINRAANAKKTTKSSALRKQSSRSAKAIKIR